VTQQTDRLNAALTGRYEIERELGAGGMATVYLAEDLKHKRKVALKVLKPELAAVLGAERFVVEITTTAAMQHPHILPLFDSGTADSFLFYVMPFIEGETLRDKLNRETQLGVDEAVRIAREVLDALEYAHQHGIVHRDVKPENILLHGGHAMVADFGIALAVSAAAGGRMTETGLSLGTPHYMSPEQATAEKEITARSDVYSLGSVLYEMLTGNPPFTGAAAQQIIMKIITTPAEPVTVHRKSVPANVAAAMAKSLEKLPADRFESAKAFSEALGNPAYTNATFTGAYAGSAGGNAKTFKRPFIGALVVAAALLIVALWEWRKPVTAVVSHQRIVLWENPQIRPNFVGRGLAISPDGGTVVFMDSSGPGIQLFSKARDRIDATALAGTAGVQGAPVFSPDGGWIAFIADGKLKKVPRLGGSATAIADSANAQYPAVAWLDAGNILFNDVAFNLIEVGQDGGARRRVFTVTDYTPNRGIVSVTGLPGGHAALLGVCTLGCPTSDLRVLDLRSLKVSILVDQVLAGWPLPGGAVAFVRRDGGVLAAPFDLRTLKFTRPPSPMLDGVRGDNVRADMAVSANGTVVYVAGNATAGAQQYEPVWVTRVGVATPVDSGWSIVLSQSWSKGPTISPDGRRLAVSVPRSGSVSADIYIKQLDHGPFTRITFEDYNLNPVWTPDGRWVMYSARSMLSSDTVVLRRRRADGTGGPETLFTPTGGPGIGEIVLTRDTAQYVLSRLNRSSSRDIVRWHLGDTAATPLVASRGHDLNSPALSPDGRWLAYTSNESAGRNEVFVRTYPDVNGGRWQVSQAGGSVPLWSHTGRELFYRNGAGALIAATVLPGSSFTLGAQAVLFDASRFLYVAARLPYDVAPDDKRFLMLRPISQSGPAGAARPDKLVQITNWAAEVHAKLAGKAPK
jgi:serine/threonine-protein kinase